jgi:hypothetical protein
VEHFGQDAVVGVALAGVFDYALEEGLVAGHPEGRLTQFVVGHLAGQVSVLPTNFSHLFYVFAQIL